MESKLLIMTAVLVTVGMIAPTIVRAAIFLAG